MPTILNQYTPEQQRRLKLAPFAVFEAIAGADGIIESKERQDFIDHIKTYDTKEHPLAHAVMEAIGEEPAEMMKILGESTNDSSSLYHLSTTMEAAEPPSGAPMAGSPDAVVARNRVLPSRSRLASEGNVANTT